MRRGTKCGAALAVAVLVGATALAGCSSDSNGGNQATTTSSGAAAAGAPCTHSAILAAAQADSSLGVQSLNGFGCAGPWAYADVTVGSAAAADAVIVLHAQDASWAVADRANACTKHLVPSGLYTKACTTS